MPHALSLQYSGGIVYLSSQYAMLVDYEPKAPRRTPSGYEDVTETIDVVVYGTGVGPTATAANTLRLIERAMSLGAEYQLTGAGLPTYLHYRTSTDASEWRSEILRADVLLGEDAMKVWSQDQIPLRIVVTRRWWWEAPAPVQLPLSNGNGTNNTSGLAIWNHNDGDAGHDNFATINVVNLQAPSPLELRLKNTSFGSRTYHNFYLCLADTESFAMIEGESALSGASAVSSTGASGVSAQVGRVSGSAGTQTSQYQLLGNNIASRQGMSFHLLARCAQISKSCFVRAELWTDTSGVILDRAKEVWLSEGDHDHFQHLGTIQLPARSVPWGLTSWGALRLVLNWRFLEATTVDVDFISLMPAAPGQFRHLVQKGMATSNDWEVVDYSDGGGRQSAPLTKLTDGTTDYPVFDVNFQPLMLYTHSDVLFVLHDGVGMTPDWALSVRAWYRPRRLTV